MTYQDPPRPQAASNRMAEYEAHWHRFGVRRASRQGRFATASTGWQTLDRRLPGGGYPLGAVTELLTAAIGIGELTLLAACLEARLASHIHHQIAFVSPPYRLNAPALALGSMDRGRLPVVHCHDDSERVWCVEQMARSRAFTAFVIWGDSLDTTALRRLQLAAEQAVCPVFVYRSLERATQRSPAALRLAITCRNGHQQLQVIKCRGPAGAQLSGLEAARDVPWQMPAAAMNGFDRGAACNDSHDHIPGDRDSDGDVARAAFPPLGAR